MIHLENIHKTYFAGSPLHVLKGINMDIEKGDFVSIMGASGSGKSTLLNILGILDTYDEGKYLLNNVLIKDLSETEKRKIHFIHFNHTNPLLDLNSPQSKTVLQNGFNIAISGQMFEL